MAEILHRLKVKVSPQKVYQALTEQRGLANWWTRGVKADIHINSISQFTFDQGGTVLRMKIVKLIPNRLVVWHCLGSIADWTDTQIAFDLELAPDGESTMINFTHAHWRKADQFFAKCNFDWAHYLASLRAYLERGRGFPARG